MLSLGVAVLGAAAGCGGESTCGVLYPEAGVVTAQFPSAGPGPYAITLCIGAACQERVLMLLREPPDQAGFNERPGPWGTAHLEAAEAGDTVLLTATVLHAERPPDGEVVLLIVVGPDGATLKRGVAVKEHLTHSGCRPHESFRANID